MIIHNVRLPERPAGALADFGDMKDGIANALARASEQSMLGEFIGNRKTPVRSVWPMKAKWEKFGKWWTVIAKDGDVTFRQGFGPVMPMVIQLFYIKRDDGMVEQLAWERRDLWERWVREGHEPTINIVGEHTTIEFH